MAEDREDQKQPALTDEEMRKLLKPIPCEEDVLKILTSSYVTEAGNARVVCQLDSYDDCNYKVEIGSEPFLLKIHNGVESTDFLSVFEASGGDYYKPGHAGSVIHFQNAIAETLTLHHIPTSVPVKPLNSASPVSVHTLPVLSEKHSPAQLVVRLLSWVPGRPMSEIRLLPLEVLANAGRTLGKVDAALDNMVPDSPLTLYHRAEYNQYHAKNGDTPSDEHLHDTSLMVAARRYHVWDGKHTEDLKKFVYCIKDDNRRAMVDSVIAAFTREKVKGVSFRTGIIQGDFNDANILVDHDWHVSGVIDFGDSVESWRVLDVTVAMAYGMLTSYGKANRSISAAAAILRGYNGVYPLTDAERKHLVLLISCRLACSCILGAFSYQQDPSNKYLLLHSEPAWKALELIWGYDAGQRVTLAAAINRVFQQACLYTDSREEIVTCYDLVMPDPTVADLLQSVRVRSIFDTVETKPQKKRKLCTSNTNGHVITFVTGNAKKLEEVKRILGINEGQSGLPYELTNIQIDLPELQGETLNVAREKCLVAADRVGGAVIVEDTSLCFNALNGMPGVFIKWFLDSCGHEGLNRMIVDFDNKTAYAQTVVAFSPGPGHEPVLFDGRTSGKIVMPRGKLDFGWDPIFEPDEGGGKTYAEMTEEEKDAISHRSRAFDQTREYLRKFQTSILGEMYE